MQKKVINKCVQIIKNKSQLQSKCAGECIEIVVVGNDHVSSDNTEPPLHPCLFACEPMTSSSVCFCFLFVLVTVRSLILCLITSSLGYWVLSLFHKLVDCFSYGQMFGDLIVFDVYLRWTAVKCENDFLGNCGFQSWSIWLLCYQMLPELSVCHFSFSSTTLLLLFVSSCPSAAASCLCSWWLLWCGRSNKAAGRHGDEK